jgi:hypothetical protein
MNQVILLKPHYASGNLSFQFLKNCLYLVSCYSFQKHSYLLYMYT